MFAKQARKPPAEPVLAAAGQRPARRRVPGGWRAVGYAVLVHIVLVVLLVVGVQWQREPAEPIQAYVATEQPAPTPKPPAAAEPPQAEERHAEDRRKEEARKQAEVEAQRKQAEAKRRAEEEKRHAEEKQRAEAERKQAEARRREEDARRRRQAEEALKESLVAEERSREEAARAARLEAQQAQFADRIRAHVMRYAQRTPGLPAGLKCTVRIRLTATGNVLDVRVVRPSGNAAFDRDAENSVRRAEPLPVPQDAAVFEMVREIEFVFNPQQ